MEHYITFLLVSEGILETFKLSIKVFMIQNWWKHYCLDTTFALIVLPNLTKQMMKTEKDRIVEILCTIYAEVRT